MVLVLWIALIITCARSLVSWGTPPLAQAFLLAVNVKYMAAFAVALYR